MCLQSDMVCLIPDSLASEIDYWLYQLARSDKVY